MANLPLAFAEVMVGAIFLDAAIKGDSIANVIKGAATQHPLAGEGAGGQSSSGVGQSVVGNIAPGTYTNPLPGAKTGRIDQGVDYTGHEFVAPGKSKILVANQSDSGWAGGGYLAAQLLDGPLAGAVYYIAEGFSPGVQVGQIIDAGARLGIATINPYNGTLGNIEAGWADPSSPGRPLAQSLSGYGGDQSSQALTAGYSFSKFVEALGGVGGVFSGAGQALAGAIEQAFSTHHAAGVPYG